MHIWRSSTIFELHKRLTARAQRHGTYIGLQESQKDHGIPIIIIVHHLERLDTTIPAYLRDRYTTLVQLESEPPCDCLKCLKYDLICLCQKISLCRSPPPKRTGMAKPSDVAPATSPVPQWIKPSGTGIASSSQTTGRTPAPIGETPQGPDPNPNDNETNPKPEDENKPPDGIPDEDQEIQVEEEEGDQDHNPHKELHLIGNQIAKKMSQNSSIHLREQKISPDGPNTSN